MSEGTNTELWLTDELLCEEDDEERVVEWLLWDDEPPMIFVLWDMPLPGIPNVCFTPFEPKLKLFPRPPSDMLAPDFEKFTFTPLHIFTDLRKRVPIFIPLL